jgi:drug/metabolite transporter (DMT)-like permease
MIIPMSCLTESGLQLLGAAFAIGAAAFWIYSARVEMPSTAVDEMSFRDMELISDAFGRQSRRSAWAAWCAAGAAILGAVLIFSPTCINLD